MLSPEPVEVKIAPNRYGPVRRWVGILKQHSSRAVVISFAAAVFLGCTISPPSLMDDVDAVQAQISRNMIRSGDWVTPRLDGVAYMEKAPLKYWMIAVSFIVFGEHDWAARLPVALCAVLLCWLVAEFGGWAFGKQAGMYGGIVLATCVGLFLFTRVLIPDCMLTLAIAAAMFAFMRLMDDEKRSPRWPILFWTSMAAAVLLKGLIGAVFPLAIAIIYLLATGSFFRRDSWSRLRLIPGILLFLVIAAPWHFLAMVRNPPLFDFTMHSESGAYHGFFWFYFINEQVLRFLNKRYPRDYNTVPRVYFWLFHLLWLFPWSLYIPAIFKLSYRSGDRAARVRLLALCWAAVVLIFFSFSTTQEYYSLPCYPALALLLGSAMACDTNIRRFSTRAAGTIAAISLVVTLLVLYKVHAVATPGDISDALTQHPQAYTLSLGHIEDLTLDAFAYLRRPLGVAAIALAIGALGAWTLSRERAFYALATMMVLLFHAARLALVVFDPYLSSRPLAQAYLQSPKGQLIIDNPYWESSSVFFYSNTDGLILNGRRNNLEYGSYAPGAPDIFIDDAKFTTLWKGSSKYYIVADGPDVARLESLVGKSSLFLVKESGGKFLFANQ